ncbi:sensor histidine kinase [Aureimonas frigidaquae]|uniref:sensor histidine kinase n=1 Tax=Aureimonas frigidaquae TaxID=424757 RepID=UPI0012EED994|nr:histidine kinase [Aureimonas frigidaquae]
MPYPDRARHDRGDAGVSLQARLIAAILCALIAILALGGAATVLHVRERIETEMRSAHIVAEHRIARQIAELPAALDPQEKFRALIRTFDSDRHARLALLGGDGRTVQASHLNQPRDPAPAWFAQLFAPPAQVSVVPLALSGPVSALELTIDPTSHTRDVWTDLGLGLTILALFVCLSLLLVYAIARSALGPLTAVRASLHDIGAGRYDTQIAPSGPPEIQALAASCNDMAARLSAMAAENRRLGALIDRMQEEERAELARDLHDEVGPFLFAIDVDAAGIEAASGGEIAERAGAIRKATAHARQAVRRILANLRPGLLPGLGLRETLEQLCREFAARRPEISFELEIDADTFGEESDATLLLVIREAMLNALRHGHPRRIALAVSAEAGAVRFRVGDDGGGPVGERRQGYGISGMIERVEAAGGTIAIAATAQPAGLVVSGALPLAAARAMPGPGREAQAA